MTTTDHMREYGVCEGCPGTTHACTYGVRCIRTRKNKKNKQKKQNGRATAKVAKRPKEGKQHKRRQEKREKRKRIQNKKQNVNIACPKTYSKKKRARKEQNIVLNGELWPSRILQQHG